MPRLKLTIAYVGTQYHGWQTQARKNASPLNPLLLAAS